MILIFIVCIYHLEITSVTVKEKQYTFLQITTFANIQIYLIKNNKHEKKNKKKEKKKKRNTKIK